MPKPNRGKTIKLSILLSPKAKTNIAAAARNLGVSKAGVILFELAKLLKNPPSVPRMEELENDITLEREHFVMTINETLDEKINEFAAKYKSTGMKKNRIVGLVVSEHFESLGDLKAKPGTDPKDRDKIMLKVNENVKKKMMTYSETYFIPLSAIVSYAVLHAENMEIPYEVNEGEMEKFYTNVPNYIRELITDQAEMLNIQEYFYTGLCLYNQFMKEQGRFY